MNIERVKILEEFYKDNPADPFNIYALALEYQNSNSEKATALFEKLLTDFEDYLPTYYQAVEFFAYKNQLAKAIEIAKKGIEKATAAKEIKTMGEIRSLLNSIDDSF